MSSSLNRIKKNMIEAMQSANNQGTSAYDSVAEVRRVEGDTAWVHIAGGVDETPVKLTIAAKAGDVVQVRVGGGRAWITGNASAPPTDDKTAIAAKSLANTAGNRANTAKATADTAQSTAAEAQSAANFAANAASAAHTKAEEAAIAAATAQTKADAASTAASTAQSSAATAAQAAATAQSTADAAKASASSAASAASAAQTKANEAASAAETAQSKAYSAGTAASKAQSSANAAGEAAAFAQAAAEAAQSTADNAQTAADSASSAASSAQSAASKAQKTADTAKENAAAAQSTADTAKTNAATAQTKANEVASAAETAQSDINSQREYFWHDANGAHVLGSKTASTRYRTDIDAEGMHIKDVSGEVQEVAKFTADGTQIGKTGEAHQELDYHSWRLTDKDGNVFAEVKDLRGKDGTATIIAKFKGDGETTEFSLPVTATEIVDITVDGTSTEATLTELNTEIKFVSAPAQKAKIICTYKTDDERAKSYTFGKRVANKNTGAYSFAEGINAVASGKCSHSEGLGGYAEGNCSHAEGWATTASEDCAHAEGIGTHAKGYCSHAEGKQTEAQGDWSHSAGYRTIAGFDNQMVIGSYNDNKEDSLFEIGNGTYRSHSNAFRVTKDGKAYDGERCLSDIATKLEDSGWIEANGKFCKYRRKNGIVTVCGYSAEGGLEIKNSYKVIATLPAGMRPSDSIYFAVNPLGGNASMSGFVNAAGAINLYSSMATTYWAYSLTYPVDD